MSQNPAYLKTSLDDIFSVSGCSKLSDGDVLRWDVFDLVFTQTYDLFLIFQKIEPWEAEKTVADREEYIWEDSPSQKNILDMLLHMKVAGEGESEEVREQLLGRREVQEYKDSVTRLKNEGENEDTMLQYKEAVKKVLNL